MDDFTISLLYPSDYVKAEDLRGVGVEVTIDSVAIQELPMTKGKKKRSVVINLRGKSKKFVACKTNGMALAVLFGGTSGTWLGKRIILIPDMDTLGKKVVPCIRIGGSPDAAPERAAAYARAWKGERKGGSLVARLKDAHAFLNPVKEQPTEPEGPEESETQDNPDPTS